MAPLARGRDGLKRDFDVLLCGYYGFGNLGDELLAHSLIALLERQGISRERIAILSACPEESRKTFGVEAFDRWSPWAIFRALSRSGSLVLGGGGLFQDTTSLRSPFYYWAIVRMATFLGCTPWCFGQSVGPLKTRWGRWLARNAMKRCASRYVRDERSHALLAQWGLESGISPDLVISMPVKKPEDSKGYILVNIRSWSGNLPERFAGVVADLSRKTGTPLLGVALVGDDLHIMEDLKARGFLPGDMAVRFLEPGNLSEVLGQGALAVGMRLHFNVLALIHGLSCIAVPYDPKVEAFAVAWGIPVWQGEGPLPETGGAGVCPDDLEKARSAVRVAFQAAWGSVEKEILR